MSATDVVEQVRAVAARVAASHGLEIFDVQFRREASGMVLRVQIDRPGPAATAEESVSVEDCARGEPGSERGAGRRGRRAERPTPWRCRRPGLDRPLRSADDYRRFAGRRAKLVMREAVDGQTFFKGRLGGVRGRRGCVIDAEDGAGTGCRSAIITRANLEVEF